MIIRTSHRRYASLAGLLLGIGAAHAETTAPEKPLEEVIVSGGLLQRSTLDTVASISIVPAEQLQAQNIRDLYDLLLRQPNLNAAKEDKFSVRGISNEGVGPGGTGRPTVSIFIDGVRQAGRGVANTWDVRQVEFYRGPQSTAFGPGSLAGAVVIQTHEPNYESADGELKLGGGNYGGREAGIAFGAPLGAGFAFRYAGETNQTDGEVTNITLDDDEWQARKRYMQRLKLGWTNDSWYSATLTGQVSKLREGIEYLPPERAENRESTDNVDGYYRDDTTLLALTQRASIGNHWQLSLTLSHSDTDNEKLGDYDVSAEDNGSFLNATTIKNTAGDLRLRYTAPRWTAVAGYYRSRDDLSGTSYTRGLTLSAGGALVEVDGLLGAGRIADVEALYMESDIDLFSRWMLTVGMRYEENEAENSSLFRLDRAQAVDPITGTTLPGNLSPVLKATVFPDSDNSFPSADSVFLPKLGVTYEASEHLKLFLTHSQGYRAGSVDFVTSGEAPAYGPEYTENFDLGFRFHRGSWRVQGSLFHVDYEDMQVGVRIDATNFRTDNAGEARARGVELEFSGDLGAGFSVFGGLGYVDSQFVTYEDDGVDFAGNEFPNAPRHTRNLGVEYHHPQGWYASVTWSRSSESYTDRENTESLQADARDLFGARLGYEAESFRVELYGQNLTDKFYITDQFSSPSLGIEGVWAGDPKEYGARLSYRF
ncbi:TonB-dependent receptor [Litorivivens sp.]|uniref:TonB-dependent receptor n=1 Tax=Litorivivens sp. TaxID=2020868 RepID=UPI00356332BF